MRISDWSSDVCSSDLTAEEEPADAETTTEDGETTDSTEPTTETTDTTVAEVQPGDTECPPADGAERTIDFDGPFADCLEEGVDYPARFTTTEGEVLVELLEDEMPNTVTNIVAIATNRKSDW